MIAAALRAGALFLVVWANLSPVGLAQFSESETREVTPINAAVDSRGELVTMDLWIVSLRTPKDVVQEDQLGPLLMKVEDGPATIGDRDEVRQLLDRFRDRQSIRRLQTYRVSSLSDRTGTLIGGENVPVVIGTMLSDRGQSNNIQYQQVGTSLKLTPKVVGDGMIVVRVEYQSSGLETSDDVAITKPAAGEPTPATRNQSVTLNTTAMVKNGSAVLIALESDSNQEDSKLVILSATIVDSPSRSGAVPRPQPPSSN